MPKEHSRCVIPFRFFCVKMKSTDYNGCHFCFRKICWPKCEIKCVLPCFGARKEMQHLSVQIFLRGKIHGGFYSDFVAMHRLQLFPFKVKQTCSKRSFYNSDF